MLETADTARLFLALSVCLGLIVAGVGNALVGSRRAAGALPFAAAGVAVAAGVAWLFESPWVVHVAGRGVGGLALLALGGSGRVRRGLAAGVAPFRSPRARWAMVAVTGLAGLGYELSRYERADTAALDASMDDIALLGDATVGVVVPGVRFHTDSGHAVTPIVAETQHSAEHLRRVEAVTLAGLGGRTQIISRGPPSGGSNCHGWVFTGGRYGIRGRDVPAILADNGYARVSAPAPGDACVYRSAAGEVSHTAVVRAVCDDGMVLVEGKWGWLGVYLHPVEASCYGTAFDYYRTARKSHLLAAVTDTPTPAAKAGP